MRVRCVRPGNGPDLLDGGVYEALPDPGAQAEGLLRVVDLSGEDYLYPAGWFVPYEESDEPY